MWGIRYNANVQHISKYWEKTVYCILFFSKQFKNAHEFIILVCFKHVKVKFASLGCCHLGINPT